MGHFLRKEGVPQQPKKIIISSDSLLLKIDNTLEEKTARGFEDPFKRATLNSPGMSPNPGILYVPGPLVKLVPVGE